jgi:hypothetical protein
VEVGDLETWHSGPGQPVILTESANTLIVRDCTQVTAARKRFIRLKVTQPWCAAGADADPHLHA